MLTTIVPSSVRPANTSTDRNSVGSSTTTKFGLYMEQWSLIGSLLILV